MGALIFPFICVFFLFWNKISGLKTNTFAHLCLVFFLFEHCKHDWHVEDKFSPIHVITLFMITEIVIKN